MNIYLVVCGLKKSPHRDSISFNNKEKAITCAAEIASSGCWEDNLGGFYLENALLLSIIKLHVGTLNATECQLVLNDGRFIIKEKPTDGNQ